jgi:hypothetical protein
MRLLALLPAVLSASENAREGAETSICGNIVEERARPPRVADSGCAFLVTPPCDFASEEFTVSLASRPPPVKAADGGTPPSGMRVDDRLRPPGEGRVGVRLDVWGMNEAEDLCGGVEVKGPEWEEENEKSEKTVLSADAEEDEPTGKVEDVGLEEETLPEPTTLIVACELDSLLELFKESCEAGREVTLKAGGGERSRISVGTIGRGSVRS